MQRFSIWKRQYTFQYAYLLSIQGYSEAQEDYIRVSLGDEVLEEKLHLLRWLIVCLGKSFLWHLMFFFVL